MKTTNITTNRISMTWNESITALSKLDGRVYVHLTTPEIERQFLRQAEEEGFTFPDGVSPTSREPAEIMAVNPDRTINYVGTIGRIAFGSGVKAISGKRLLRVMIT